jgi:asparagine synthase (glutamine-hydrolysing)
MRRVIAGAYDATGTGLPDRARLAAAVGGGDVHLEDLGPLRIAVAGGSDAVGRAGATVAILDGDVYNLDDLAHQTGLAPRRRSPEPLLAALHGRLGDALLPRLRGDFMLLLWDGERDSGLLVRDQTAGRALVHASSGGRLLFASEISHLLALMPATPAPDPVSMAHWLNVSAPPGDRTLYRGVQRLPAGHLLRLDRGGIRASRYWTPRYRGTLRGSRDELATGLREVLTEAVRRRLMPEDRTGVLLSGGLDSSSVAAVAMRLVDPELRPRTAYSAVFPRHPSTDESGLIASLARDLRFDPVWMEVNGGSLFPGALDYLRTWRVPPTSPNLFFWNPMFRHAAAAGLTSLLDGEGGDQVFGLSPYLLADRMRRGRMLSALRLARRMPGAGPNPPWRSVRRKLLHVGVRGALPLGVQAWRRARAPAERYASPWLLPETARAFGEGDEAWRWRGRSGPLWWNYQVKETTTGIGPALTLDHVRRRNTMSGITPRHPLLDVDVIEYMLRVPPETAYDWRYSRPLLRDSLAGVLTDELRLRPEKSNFDAIFHESLLGHDMPTVRRLLLSGDAEIRAYADQERLRTDLLELAPERYPRGLVWWALPVWRATTAELFLRGLADPARLDAIMEAAAPRAPDVRIRRATVGERAAA